MQRKRVMIIVLLLAACLGLAGCRSGTAQEDSASDAGGSQTEGASDKGGTAAEDTAENREEETGGETMQVTVNGQTFQIVLYDNEAAEALKEKLPMTLDMSELNGNEKYYYMQESMPTDAERVGSIKTGDLMLYGSDCLVLFYKDFSTSYSYTKLGYMEDASGLADALGSGSVQVQFQLN